MRFFNCFFWYGQTRNAAIEFVAGVLGQAFPPVSFADIPPFGGNLGRAYSGMGICAPRTGGGREARGEGGCGAN
jgi:hypothetical protein